MPTSYRFPGCPRNKVFIYIASLMLLLISLVSCGGSSQSTTPTPTVPSLQYTTPNLGLPP